MSDKPEKKRGRPKGLPKTGGRKRGVPNRTTAQIREFIAKHADPYPFLAAVYKGRKIKVPDPENPGKAVRAFPTLDQRLIAAKILAPKVAPDMRENTLKGEGVPLSVNINLGPPKAA